jgi:hypothetical protein
MDTLYHILNGCPKLIAHYTNRHHKIAQVVDESVRANCNLFEENIYENRCMNIDEKLSKVGSVKLKFD